MAGLCDARSGSLFGYCWGFPDLATNRRMPRQNARAPLGDSAQLTRQIGQLVVRFQDGTAHMDRAACRVLGLDHQDLPALAALLFGGPATKTALAARFSESPTAFRKMLNRLEYAGYVHQNPLSGNVELTHHARNWIATLWQPLQEGGSKLCGNYSPAQLASVADFLARACQVQERHAARVLKLLEEPKTELPTRSRGGLSPAALRRVQVFVESNLSDNIRLADLAGRAQLSTFHFSRAFKQSTGTTPRAYVEARRVAAAERLLRETDLSLARVALAVGFGNQSRLTTAFRRATGFTPARFRQQSRHS